MQSLRGRAITAAAVLFFFIFFIYFIYFVDLARIKSPPAVDLTSGSATLTDPDTILVQAVQQAKESLPFRVVVLIFYGRRRFASILDCYLQRNLVRNGGVLDEVIFVIRTQDRDDLEWVDGVLATTPEYTKNTDSQGRGGKYADSWNMVQNGTMYLKIDDDLLFIEDSAIPSLVKRKLDHPEYFLIAANSVNQPALSWVHFHLGAHLSYLPETTPPADFTPRVVGANTSSPTYHDQKKPTWRASELPVWDGPANLTVNKDTPAPFVGHRWLPLPPGADIVETPVAGVEYSWRGRGLSWPVAAQQHYSFFERLEKKELDKFKYDIWDYHYGRLSINFICLWGHDILQVAPIPDEDEVHLTEVAPRKLGRHAVMDGTLLVSHFGYSAQYKANRWHGLYDTDLLDRYRAFAEERVCGKRRGTMMDF